MATYTCPHHSHQKHKSLPHIRKAPLSIRDLQAEKSMWPATRQIVLSTPLLDKRIVNHSKLLS